MKLRFVWLVSVVLILVISQGLAIGKQQFWQTNDYDVRLFGRSVDVFTQKGGKGDSVPSDHFEPQEMVILYANITYNEYPIQNKIATFEVRDPHDHIISILYAVTNESGIATSSFRPLWLPDEPEKYLGIWKVTATVDIADEIVHDTVEFELGFFDVAIIDVTPSKTIVGETYTALINVTAENQGSFNETLCISVYANTTLIETKIVNIITTTSVVLTFTWQTTDFDKGYYTISAHATPIVGETETGDNTFTYHQIRLVTSGNVNGDEIVNMEDVYTLVLHFLCEIGDDYFLANCDIDSDGAINMRDVYIAILNFLETEP